MVMQRLMAVFIKLEIITANPIVILVDFILDW
jgi:hypothetical protein